MMDYMPDPPKSAEALTQELIEALIKEYPAMSHLKTDMKKTPHRFVETLRYMFRGYALEEKHLSKLLKPVYLATYKGMVVQKNTVAFSMCPHHLLPIKYSFAIGYIPSKNKAVGLSKLAHLCGYFAARPDLQETMTTNIVQAMETYLKPKGSAVVVIGRHDCILLGAGETQGPEFKQLHATTRDDVYNVTAELRGQFKKADVKAEFYAQIQDWLNNGGGI